MPNGWETSDDFGDEVHSAITAMFGIAQTDQSLTHFAVDLATIWIWGPV